MIENVIKKIDLHSDERGWLAEVIKETEIEKDIKQVYVATINPQHIRGNHYHLKRLEWFFICKGEAEIYLENIETKEKNIIKVSSKTPQRITIPLGVAHSVKNTGESIAYLISAQSDVYNPKDTDTFSYLVCE